VNREPTLLPHAARNQRQLALLREIDHLLGTGRIRYWLRGGWALDFLLGEATREHDDIDLVTWKRHRSRIHQILHEHGFAEVDSTGSYLQFEKESEIVSILFIARRPDGAIVTTGFERGAPLFWNDEPLRDPVRRLSDIECRVISVEGQIREKQETPGWIGRPAREKDLRALEALIRFRRTSTVTNGRH
jgi:hypothetical protein